MRGGVFVSSLPMKIKVVRAKRGDAECDIVLVDENGAVLPGLTGCTIKTSSKDATRVTAEFLVGDNPNFRLALDEVVELPRPGSWRGRSA